MRGATGVSGAAPIWHSFMEAVLADPTLLAMLDAPAQSEAWSFAPPPGIQQLALCPPGLSCRQDGEYFSAEWLQQNGGDPLRDSVVQKAAAPVYVESAEGRRQAGFCSVPQVPADTAPRILLALPSGLGAAAAPAPGEQISPSTPALLDQVRQEQRQALAWSLAAALPIDLGNCAGVEQTVQSLLPSDQQTSARVVIDLSALAIYP